MQTLHPGRPPLTSLWGNVIVFWLGLSFRYWIIVGRCGLVGGFLRASWRGSWDRTDSPGLSLIRREASVCLKWMRVYDDKYDSLWLSPGKGKSLLSKPLHGCFLLHRWSLPKNVFVVSVHWIIEWGKCSKISASLSTNQKPKVALRRLQKKPA